MYDEPGRIDALGKHRLNPKVILRLRRLILTPTNNQDEIRGVSHALEMQASHPPRTSLATWAGTPNTASPEIFGTGPLIR